MNILISLALLFFIAVFADDDGEKITWDSSDEESTNSTASDQSYDGAVIRLIQEDGAPTVALATDLDDYDTVYCLSFEGLFESEDYNRTTGEYTIVDGSEVDFGTDVDFTYESLSSTEFIVTGTIGDITLTLDFVFVETIEGTQFAKYLKFISNYL